MMKMKKLVCGTLAALFAFSFSSCALLENFQTDTQAQLDELNAKIELQAQEINVLKADKDELTEEVNGLKSDKDALTETVNGLQADNATLSNEVNGLKADKDSLTEAVNGLQADNATLSDEVDDLKADKDALLEELNVLKAYKETLTAELNEMEEDNERLLRELNATEEQMEIILQKLETSYAETYEEVMDWYYETYAPFGVFVDLQTAYDYGLLTKDDLMSIAYYQFGGRYKNEDIMPEDYTPQPKNPETIDEATEREMFAPYTGRVRKYYGAYNGVYAVLLSSGITSQDFYYDTIGGVVFKRGGPIDIDVYIPISAYPEIVAQIIKDREN